MCYMIVKNTSSPPDAPRSPAPAPGGHHRLPPGVLSCRWPALSPHAFVTCLLSRQSAAYNSRCSTRWLSSPDRTLPRRPQLPARRRRPRFILRRFFRLFRQLHRDFFFYLRVRPWASRAFDTPVALHWAVCCTPSCARPSACVRCASTHQLARLKTQLRSILSHPASG